MSAISPGARPLPATPGSSLREPLPRALLILTAATGMIDAVSFLGLGRVFSANMTGNVVFLGFGLAGAGGLPVVSPLIAAAAFLIGAGIGGRLAAGLPAGESTLRATLVIEVVLLALAAALAAAVSIRANAVSGDSLIAILALAMGTRNAAVRRAAIPDMTTTVLTMTLTALAADSAPAGGSGKGTTRRIAAVAAMLVGALVGALLVQTDLVLPLLAAAGVTLLALCVYERP